MKVSDIFKRPFKTPFDILDFSFNVGQTGGPIRDRLLEIQNQFGSVSEMSTIAAKRVDIAEARQDMASRLAIAEISEKFSGDRSYTAERKKAMASNWEVLLPGDSEKTTPYQEEVKYISYKYVAQRGKDRMKELSSAIDLGRSVLSWDKQEVDRLEK